MKFLKRLPIIILCLLSGCDNIVRICIETPKRIEEATMYTDQIPITAEKLRQLVEKDTSHYKIIVLYSVCCGPCMDMFKHTYSHMWKNSDTSQIKWYFIQDDCSGVKWNTEFLTNFGINTTMYYLRDTLPEFKTYTEHRINNLINYIIPFSEHKVDNMFGVPTDIVINKKGVAKIEKVIYKNNTSRTSTYSLPYYEKHDDIPPTLHFLQKLDFTKTDTTYIRNRNAYSPNFSNENCIGGKCK